MEWLCFDTAAEWQENTSRVVLIMFTRKQGDKSCHIIIKNLFLIGKTSTHLSLSEEKSQLAFFPRDWMVF